MEKILVCITAQSNSHRLIDKAAEEAEFLNGELHILNVEKGDNIFFNDNSPTLLEELFNYGSKKGGIVHALAGGNVSELIKDFAMKNNITRIILGEPPGGALPQNSEIIGSLKDSLKKIEFIIIKRES